MNRILLFALALILALQPCAVRAEAAEVSAATDISGAALVSSYSGFSHSKYLFDGITQYGVDGYTINGMLPHLTLEHSEGIGSLYILFQDHDLYTITDNATGECITVGEHGFYHQFLDLTELFGYAPSSVTLHFPVLPVTILELYAFTEGEVPSFVQKWHPPAEGEADLLLLSAHGDDEQLFFGGLIPFYAGELGYKIQVVYMTPHRSEPYRIHEMLDGLWACGLDIYPVVGTFDDFFVEEGRMDLAYALYDELGQPREMLLDFVVEQLRRFQPDVAVTHDFNGEYGHAQHMVCADLMAEAVTISGDAAYYPDSASLYGPWDVPKTYIHLYEENRITLDLDQPLLRFDGMTAFQVTQEIGFPSHESQYDTFKWYFPDSGLATDVEKFSPCFYGLYRSTVGEDVEKNDMFENLTSEALPPETEYTEPEEIIPEETEATEPSAPEEAVPATDPAPIQERVPQDQDRLLPTVILFAVSSLGLLVCICVSISHSRKKKR